MLPPGHVRADLYPIVSFSGIVGTCIVDEFEFVLRYLLLGRTHLPSSTCCVVARGEEIDSLEQDIQDVRDVLRYDVRRPLVWTSEGFHIRSSFLGGCYAMTFLFSTMSNDTLRCNDCVKFTWAYS